MMGARCRLTYRIACRDQKLQLADPYQLSLEIEPCLTALTPSSSLLHGKTALANFLVTRTENYQHTHSRLSGLLLVNN